MWTVTVWTPVSVKFDKNGLFKVGFKLGVKVGRGEMIMGEFFDIFGFFVKKVVHIDRGDKI